MKTFHEWQTYLVFVTTITTAGCVKKLSHMYNFPITMQKDYFTHCVKFTHTVKSYTQFCREKTLSRIYALSIQV